MNIFVNITVSLMVVFVSFQSYANNTHHAVEVLAQAVWLPGENRTLSTLDRRLTKDFLTEPRFIINSGKTNIQQQVDGFHKLKTTTGRYNLYFNEDKGSQSTRVTALTDSQNYELLSSFYLHSMKFPEYENIRVLVTVGNSKRNIGYETIGVSFVEARSPSVANPHSFQEPDLAEFVPAATDIIDNMYDFDIFYNYLDNEKNRFGYFARLNFILEFAPNSSIEDKGQGLRLLLTSIGKHYW